MRSKVGHSEIRRIGLRRTLPGPMYRLSTACGRCRRASRGLRQSGAVPRARRPQVLHAAVFRGRDVIRDGVLTRDELRSSAWRKLFHGVYADAQLPETFGVRLRGARLLAPPTAVFCGRTAAYLHGATSLVESDSPVELVVPPTSRFGAAVGLHVRRASMPATDVSRLGRFRCTTGLRTAVDIARLEPLVDAVPALDVLLAARVTDRASLTMAVGRLTGVRGARCARKATALADDRAESQPESRLRVLLALAGCPAVPQFVVRDADGFLARVDLAYPDHRVAIEYDGAWHASPEQLRRDRRRLNRLVAAGWTVIHVTAADLRTPDTLLRQIRAVLDHRDMR